MPPPAIATCPDLATPGALRAVLPLPPQLAAAIAAQRRAIAACMAGEDPRLLVIVGPCSIHDVAAARDYAGRLRELADRHAAELLVVMRVYLEKPRTRLGWRGLVADPHLDGSRDLATGLHQGRRLLLDVLGQGLPTAGELLDPIVARYLSDLYCWAAIGARTTESQTHRELASGLPMCVGCKNGTSGDPAGAIDAMHAIAAPHAVLDVGEDGRVAVRRTPGNRATHLVLRGGHAGPNYDADAVAATAATLTAADLPPRLMVDCSHGNAGRCHRRQSAVADAVAEQVTAGCPAIRGVMLESNLVAGRQDPGNGTGLVYGQSITDACLGLPETARALARLARAQRAAGG
jgi:3-deoxy-7-phosphoheptulonate synthase